MPHHRADLALFVRYAAANVLGMLGLSCYILADTFFISLAMGVDGLAALNLALPVYSLVHGCGLMLGMGGGACFSLAGGGREGGRALARTLCLAAVLSLLFAGAGAALAPSMAWALGARGEALPMTGTYLRGILLFAPAFIANDVAVCFVRNDGGPRLAMAAMLSGSLSNIALDFLFMFPLGMGMTGAVLATGLAAVISLGVALLHLRRPNCGLRPASPGRGLRPWCRVISLGVPSLVTEGSSGVVMLAYNALLLSLGGSDAVAAYGVVANLSLVVCALFTGVAQGAQPLLSRARGAGDGAGAARLLRYTFAAVLGLAAAVGTVILAGAEPIAASFNSEGSAALQELAIPGLRLYFLAAPFVGVNTAAVFSLAAADQAVPAQTVSLLRGLILILPAAFLLARLAGITGIWLSYPVTEALTALAAVILLRRRWA